MPEPIINRLVLDCPPKRGIGIFLPGIDTNLSGEIVNAPAYAQAETSSQDNVFSIFIGDNTNENQAAAGVKLNGNQIVLKPFAPGYGQINTQIEADTAYWQIASTQILTRVLPSGIKTTLYCGAGAVLDNLLFTVKLPANGTLDALECGEIAVKFDGVECGYLPKPVGEDFEGRPIAIEFLIHPNITIGGVSYPLIQICPTITAEHIFPIALDPSLSYDYNDIREVRAFSTEDWTFDRTGSGKSWGAAGENLGDFPEIPVVVIRGIDTANVAIYDTDLEAAANPWIAFNKGATNILKNAYNTLHSVWLRNGKMCFSGAGSEENTNLAAINFAENWGAGGDKSSVQVDNTGVGNCYGYNTDIQNRNAGSDFVSLGELPVKRLTAIRSRILLRDSAGNIYIMGQQAVAGDYYLSVIRDDFSYYGTLNANNPLRGAYNSIVQFKETTGNTYPVVTISSITNNIAFIKESEWVKSGNFSRQFRLTDAASAGILTSKADYVYYVKSKVSNYNQIVVIKGTTAIETYSGDTSIATLITAGHAFRVACISDTADAEFKIIPDIFGGGAASNLGYGIQEVVGDNYIICCGYNGMFALDVTDKDNPTLNGVLTQTEATGIFTDMELLPAKPSVYKVILNAGGAKVGTNRVIYYNNGIKLWIYRSSAADTTAPTVPAITYPTAGATNIPLSPTVTWDASTDDSPPIYYQLQIATDSGFTAIIYDSGWVTGLSKLVSPALSPLTTYYRRIRAKDSA